MLRFIDISAIASIIAFISLVLALMLLDVLDGFPVPSSEYTAKYILETVASYSVIVFIAGGVVLWVHGLVWFKQKFENLTFKERIIWLIFLLGFSWVAGLYIYFLERKKARASVCLSR